MSMELPVNEAWKQHLVATRTSSGQILLLLEVRKETCDNCKYGTVVHTVWCAPTGDCEEIAWCSSCFNAEWRHEVELAEEWDRRDALIRRMYAEARLECWNGAKAAIAHLEQVGLV